MGKCKEKIIKIVSRFARRNNIENYFVLRKKYYSSKGIITKILCSYRLKRMESSQGSYVGLPANEDLFANAPIFPHGLLSIFIDGKAKIGKDCIIHEQVVIGRSKGKSPDIGDGCFIGAGAKLIGGITIGNNCRIGAGVVVSEDVPNNTTVVSQKPRYIEKSQNYILTMNMQNGWENDERI